MLSHGPSDHAVAPGVGAWGIAFALQSIRLRRPDLKIIVMSATLDVDALRDAEAGRHTIRCDVRV